MPPRFALSAVLLTGFRFIAFCACAALLTFGPGLMTPVAAVAAIGTGAAAVPGTALFAAPVLVALAAAMAWRTGARGAAAWCLSGAALYTAGVAALTLHLHPPLDEALMALSSAHGVAEADALWAAYAGRWQGATLWRTALSGAALGLVWMGYASLRAA